MRKPTICICENKDADQLRNPQSCQISAFVFPTRIVLFLLYLNPKFRASSSCLCLYRLVCVGPVRKPHGWFSHEAAHIMYVAQTAQTKIRLLTEKQSEHKFYYLHFILYYALSVLICNHITHSPRNSRDIDFSSNISLLKTLAYGHSTYVKPHLFFFIFISHTLCLYKSQIFPLHCLCSKFVKTALFYAISRSCGAVVTNDWCIPMEIFHP